MKNFLIIFGMVILVAIGIWFFLPHNAGDTSQTISETIDGKVYNLDVASTEADREQGLGGRANLGSNQGMLFVFDAPETYGFWMKDMNFPIDVLWLNTKCAVVGKTSMTPDSYPKVFYPDYPAEYVIELPEKSTGNVYEGDILPCAPIVNAAH